MKSIIKKILSTVVVAIITLSNVPAVSAGNVSWANPNTSYGPISGLTGNSMVASKVYGATNYTQSSSVNAGDRVAVVVYFHNNGTADSNSTIIKLDNPGTSASRTFSLTGSVSGGGASNNGTTNISLSSSQTLTFIPGSLSVSYDRGNNPVRMANEADIFTSTGLNVGLVRGMNTCASNPLCAQGAVVLGFQVGDTQTSSGSRPSVVTGSYWPYSEADGFANLNGSVSPNTAASCTYFKWRNLNGGTWQTTSEDCSNTQTTGNYSFTKQISNLTSGTHEYQACARNSFGTQCGDVLTFWISRTNTPNTSNQCNDGIDNDGDGRIDYPNDQGCYGYSDDSEAPYDNQQVNLNVYTDDYSWINQDTGSVTLRGHYNGNTYGSTRTYFEYRLIGQSARTVTSDISNNSSLSFNVSLYNLTPGTYYYRACATGNYTQCGQELSFYVGQNYGYNQNSSVQTLSVLYKGQDFATFDGYLNLGSCSSAQTYFQYGRNSAYGFTTPTVYRNGSGSIAQTVTGLTPNSNYYYQAVAQGCGNTFYGAQMSFTTSAASTVYNPPVINNGGTTTVIRNVTTNTNIGGGARYIRLTIDNGRDTIVRGDELIYDVTWENITKTDLRDLVLEVSIPEGLQVVGADRGQIDRKANTIYVNIRDLRALEKDDMTIRAKVKGNLFKDNDPITARAIIAFENPENKAQENAIAYDSDTYLSTQNVLGASVFGLDFLPGTLAGWLFIILLLILVILIIRYFTRGREDHHHYYQGNGPVPAPSDVPTGNSNTVTTTQEVEYTPYRPTPKM